LFEGQKFKDAGVNRGVEADTAFVGTNGHVVLYTVAHVGLVVAFVIHPGDTEGKNTIGDTEAFDKVDFVEFGVFVVFPFDGHQHFFHRLVVLGFIRKTALEVRQHVSSLHSLEIF